MSIFTFTKKKIAFACLHLQFAHVYLYWIGAKNFHHSLLYLEKEKKEHTLYVCMFRIVKKQVKANLAKTSFLMQAFVFCSMHFNFDKQHQICIFFYFLHSRISHMIVPIDVCHKTARCCTIAGELTIYIISKVKQHLCLEGQEERK